MVGEHRMAGTTEVSAPLTPEGLRVVRVYWRDSDVLPSEFSLPMSAFAVDGGRRLHY
jgi:hypothetical protein